MPVYMITIHAFDHGPKTIHRAITNAANTASSDPTTKERIKERESPVIRLYTSTPLSKPALLN